MLYPGREGRTRRAGLAQIARQQVVAHTVARAGDGDMVVPAAAAAGQPGPEAARGLSRETAAEGGADPALLASTEGAIAAAAHALTAVIEGGAAFGSRVLGAHDGGRHGADGHGADGHGGDGRHGGDGTHGHGGHADGGNWAIGGFGRH